MPQVHPAGRRVVVFGLGGTIAMTPGDTRGVVPTLSAERLVAAVAGLADTGIAVDVVDFRRRPGASLTFDDLVELHRAIDGTLAAGADGVVVTQGTDTIEETAYLLDLLHGGPQPIVVTGAMRSPTLAGADGPANLLAAVRTAAGPELDGQGCLVVFADEIHAARRVRKTHTTSCGTFRSADGGPLGAVVEGRPVAHHRIGARTTVAAERWRPGRRVGLATITFGDDGTLVEAAADRLDGLVIAAFGAGHVPADLVPVLTAIAGRIPVVLASRTGSGAILRDTYAFPGSERDLLDRGLVGAGFLDPLKARILLHALLSTDADRATITAAFDAGLA